MTWKKFKDRIDRQLKEQGVSEDSEVRFIEIDTDSFPYCDVSVHEGELLIN